MHPASPWAFHVDPGALLLVVSMAGAYPLAIQRLAARHAPVPSRPVSRFQVVAFSLGIFSLLLSLTWPLDHLGDEFLFSAHTVQHLVLGLLAAPLLLLGVPGWMLRAALGSGRRLRVARLLCRPLTAFVIFNVAMVLTHWPALVELMNTSEPFHGAMHVMLVVAGLVMWMPLLSPLPEMPRLRPPANLLYLFLQSILPTVPASFLTFGDSTLYKFYESAPRLWGLDAIADQQVAGLIMKVGAGFLMWGMIAVLFFVWQAEEERRSARPGIDFDELEIELTAQARAASHSGHQSGLRRDR